MLDPNAGADDDEDGEGEGKKDRTAVLAIAYHNMGVEQEFLRSVWTNLTLVSTQQQFYPTKKQ